MAVFRQKLGPILQPMPVAITSLVLLTALGWGVMFAEAISMTSGAAAFMEALCAPADILGARSTAEMVSRLAVAIGMWIAMSVAMMLPTASLLIVGFADRIESELRDRARAASPLAVAAGYLAIWVIVAIVAATAQAFFSAALSGIALPPATATILAGAVIGAAGFYQFSPLKRACLVTIRHPFAQEREAALTSNLAAFRFGLRQGVLCVGCCWAMMGLLVVLGAMNILWMAIFAVIMAAEKMVDSQRLPNAVGVAMIVAGAALSVSAVGLAPLRHAIGL
jgi:predicted metal-binding membrane protein